ncbi:protoglobin domain-containing protein [Nitratiruptor sp. SB155-2]|uniref:protoglobin domain-containing protein n=1 Tax=Nitratiruptor sp. (strain SB155-2) TaxID=387092 RepID=UPI0001586EAF|nr:protoglobin domain-containing protein [Nitratiruptor sp. SB155-2]BAF69209.1 hypothetical protein NIS_0092 [Nitratiruptor sp. SB155-2]
MNAKIELVKEIYQLQDNDLQERKKALKKIEPYVDEIMDQFYKRLLQKEDFAKFISVERIPELKRKQIKFLVQLLSEPFDEKLYKRIAKVAIVHYHIQLDPIYMSYGYHILSELILAQSQKDPSILPYLKLIIKYLKVSEEIMKEEYFAQKMLAESPYRANDLFIAVNSLHMAYIRCKSSFENLRVDEKAKELFEKSLEELKEYKDVLEEAGFHLATIKRFCTQFSNEPNEKNLEALKNAIVKPLNNVNVTAYLSLTSSLATMRAMTDIVYKRTIVNEKELTIKSVQHKIFTLFSENYGWAISDIEFLDKEPESGYEIVKYMAFREKIFFLCINVRDVINKLYVVEGIDLLAEAMKLTLYNRSKE